MAVTFKLVCALMLCVMVGDIMVTNAITCGDVSRQMAPCTRYLQNGGAVPPNCCGGVRNLNNQARTTPDRQAVCRCLQQAAKAMTGLKSQFAEALPGKCGVNIPYKISASTNCNNVK